jgi:hypothetical protein
MTDHAYTPPAEVRCIKDSFGNYICTDGTRIVCDSFGNFTTSDGARILIDDRGNVLIVPGPKPFGKR